MKQALVAGGQANFVADKLSKSLARHGIRIHTHWSWDKKRPPQKFPDGLDLVYICTDMIGHNLANPCVEYARESGIPFVNGTRKWAESIERLTGAGFPLLDPLSAVPDIINEIRRTRTEKDMARGPSEEEMHALAIAFTGDIDKAKDLVAAYNAETGHVELPTQVAYPPSFATSAIAAAALQESPMSSASNVHLAVTNPKQREYLRAIAMKPDTDNVELWQALEVLPGFAGSKFDPERASTARKSLGISIVRKGGRRVTSVNIPVFTATLKTAKIDGYPMPLPSYTEPDPAVRNQFAVPPAPTPVPAAAPAPAATQPAAPPVAAPAAPVPAPTKPPLSGMDELKDLLTLVRVKMAEEALTELHITPDGVKFKQVKIVEGSLEV